MTEIVKVLLFEHIIFERSDVGKMKTSYIFLVSVSGSTIEVSSFHK